MNIKFRKIVEQKLQYKDEDGKVYKSKKCFENGFVEEKEINPSEITSFSLDKNMRMIGVNKDRYMLTLKSWKETKNELQKLGILQKFDLSQKI